MRYLFKIFLISLCIPVLTVFAGDADNNKTTQKQDSVKTVVNTEINKKPVKTPTASKGITPTKTNWSKIKDLFM